MRLRFPQHDLQLYTDEERAERGGRPAALSPLSCRLLAYLAHNRDRVVSAEELLREVWSGTRVTDAALRQGLRMLRRELGAGTRRSDVVAAVRGRGYRLATPVEEAARPGPGGLPFVGRAEAVDALLADLEAARSGGGRMALVSGPPGIGKTRLTEDIADRAGRRGFRVLSGRCAQAPVAPPLWPFEQVLRGLADADPTWLDEVPEADVRALRAGFPARGASAEPDADALAAGPKRLRLFDAIRHALHAAGERRPLLVRLDDLHEADATTLALVEWLGDHLSSLSLLLVAAHREPAASGEARFARLLPRLLRAPAVRHVPLGPLGPDAVAAAVRAVEPEAEAARIEALWRASGGHPLFLRLALESYGAPEGGAGAAEASHAVREAVLEQLAVLSAPARDVLEAACVLGLEFRRSVLAHLHPLPADALDAALAEAFASGLVRDGGRSAAGFVHALVQEALYESLAPPARRALHARAVEALEAHAPTAVAAIAEHAFRARGVLPDEAVAVRCARAARAAVQRSGFEQAARLFERALACTAIGDAERRLGLLLELAEAHGRGGEVSGARAAAEEAQGLAREAGDGAALVRSVLVHAVVRGATTGRDHRAWVQRLECALAVPGLPPAGRARLLSHLAKALWLEPPPERARGFAREGVELAQSSGDADALAEALGAAWLVLQTGRDDAGIRRQLARHMEATADLISDRLLAQEILTYLLVEAGRRGDRAEVQAFSARIRQEAERVGGPHAAWWAHVAATSLEQLRGRPHEAEREAAAGLALGLELGLPVAAPNHALQMLAIRRDQGRLGELETLLAQGAARQPNELSWTVAWRLAGLHGGARAPAHELLDGLCEAGLDRLPHNVSYLPLLVMLAELAFELAHGEAARQLRPLLAPLRAEQVFFGLGFCHWGAVIHYAGRMALVQDEWDTAIAELESGVRADRAMGAPIPAARGQAVLATALLRRDGPGDRRAARALRARVRSLQDDLGVRVHELG